MSELHRWTDHEGQQWACAAYDHGPMCRLCTMITEPIERACLELVDDGLATASTTAEGELEFMLTEAGRQHAQELIEGDPDAFALWMQAQFAAIPGPVDSDPPEMPAPFDGGGGGGYTP